MKKYSTVTIITILLIIFTALTGLQAQENSKQTEAGALIAEAAQNLKAEKFDEAIEKTTKVLEIFPKSGDVYVMRAMAYQGKNETQKAIADYSLALASKINPSLELIAHKMRGLLLYQSKKYDEAVNDFDFTISKRQDDFKDYGFRGWSHFFKGNYPKAIADFDMVLKLSPAETGFRRFRAMAHYYLENYQKSVDDITEELKINSKPPVENYQIRSNAYRKLGNTELAELDEKKYQELGGKMEELAIKLKPATESVTIYTEAKEKATRQTVYQGIKERNFDLAFREVEELLQNVPNKENISLKSLIFMARASDYFGRGEYRKALDDLNEALKLDKDSYRAYEGRAATYRKLGMTKEAEADEAKFKELKPKETKDK